MESYSLSFETTELLESLNKNFIVSKDRKAWIKNKPTIILEIDQQLRKFFDINKSRESIFSLYEFKENTKNIQIHQQKHNVVNRILISTSEDQMKTNKGKTYQMNKWEAYAVPQEFRNNNDIYFDNKVLKVKGNLRQRKKDKNRYVLVFEYIFNRSEIGELLEQISGVNIEEDLEIDTTVDSFLGV
jgi:hypothetical protein